MRRFLLALLFLLPWTLEAQSNYVRGGFVQDLPKCKKSVDGVLYAVSNADSVLALGSGLGAESALAQCDGDDEVWRPTALSTCSDLQGDPSVEIDTTDAGSDVTITPVDDFIVTTGDTVNITAVAGSIGLVSAAANVVVTAIVDFNVGASDDMNVAVSDDAEIVAGGEILLDSTGGTGITFDTDAAGSDINLTPVDDLLASVGDAFSLLSGTNSAITTTNGTVILTAGGAAGDVSILSDGGSTGVTIQTSAAGSDVVITPTDDFQVTAGDSVLLVGGATSAVSLSAGSASFSVDGTGSGTITASAGGAMLISPASLVVDVSGGTDELTLGSGTVTVSGTTTLINPTTTTFDPGGSTDELTVVSGSVRAGVALGIPAAATLPTCDSTIAPAGTTALYWDTTGPDLCACPEGVDWVTIDGSGTCA